MKRLKIETLEKCEIEQILNSAKEVLETVGVSVASEKVRKLLYDHGAKIEKVKRNKRELEGAKIPGSLVDRCLATMPKSVNMYDRKGKLTAELTGDNTYFNPGSCATNYFDCKTGRHRKPTKNDLINFTRVADHLKNMHLVSTAMVVDSIMEKRQDVYRLAKVLQNSTKPVVTGTFGENFHIMKDMLAAVRGSEEELRAKPLAIFSCCPEAPLKWTKVWSEDLMRCGKYGIPVEFISMPQPGLSGPNTLWDCVVQHTAETLSGIVISQAANPGAPLLYGGSPTAVAINEGATALLGHIGTAQMDTAYLEIANHLGLPSQAYLGLSDSKTIDVQAGYEKGTTLLLATLAGANSVSGPGMMESENCQSAEMMVIDDEICGAVLHYVKGVNYRGTDTLDELKEMAEEHYPHEDSLQYLRKDHFMPKLADNKNLGAWKKEKKGMLQKAIEKTKYILAEHHPEELPKETARYLDTCVKGLRKSYLNLYFFFSLLMNEKDVLKEAEEIDKEIVPSEQKKSSPLWYIVGVFLALLLVATVVPYYSVKLDPHPSNIPSLAEVLPLDISIEEKAANKISLNMIDGKDPSIKEVADKIAVSACSSGKVCHAKALFYFVRDNFNYVSDPTAYEYVKTAKMSLVSGGGDCDDSSVLAASLMDAVGIKSRFIFIPGHVYIEVFLPDALNRYKQDGDWVALDLTCSHCEFGEISWKSAGKNRRILG